MNTNKHKWRRAMLSMKCHFAFFALLFILLDCYKEGNGTIDVNTVQFQYLADHLKTDECRVLVAALHFQSFDLPNALYQAERKVPKDLTCLQQLLHWNSEPNNGQMNTHEVLSRRLKQINRTDLAIWLTNAAFDAIHTQQIRMYEPIHLPQINFTEASTVGLRVTTTTETLIRIVKQDVSPSDQTEDVLLDPTEWTIFDTISWTIVIILFLLVIVLLVYLTMASPCCNRKRRCTSCGSAQASPTSKYCPTSTVVTPCVQSQRHQQSHGERSHHHMSKQDHAYMMNKQEHQQIRECASPMSNSPFGMSDQSSYLTSPCLVPPPPRPICPNAVCPGKLAEYNDMRPHFNNLSRTIDIHQKIAIPMNNMDSN